MLAREAKKVDASLFALFNNDLFVVFSRDAAGRIDEVLARVCHVLGIDPYFSGGDEAAQEFCSHFDLDGGCGPLIARIEQLIQARNEKDQLARANRAVDSGGKPLDLGNLALPEKTIAQAEIGRASCRERVCQYG